MLDQREERQGEPAVLGHPKAREHPPVRGDVWLERPGVTRQSPRAASPKIGDIEVAPPGHVVLQVDLIEIDESVANAEMSPSKPAGNGPGRATVEGGQHQGWKPVGVAQGIQDLPAGRVEPRGSDKKTMPGQPCLLY